MAFAVDLNERDICDDNLFCCFNLILGLILLRLDFALKILISQPILEVLVPYESPDYPL